MIALFGPAGSGKSTHGRMLADKFGWRWLSVGQVLRDTGNYAEILKEGGLVDDEEVIRLMNREIEKADAEGANVILDGYPRDVKQAEWMRDNGVLSGIELAIVLKLPVEQLWERIEKRGREDDTKEVVERRFRVFYENFEVIRGMLEGVGVKVVEVDGVDDFEEMDEMLIGVIEENLGDIEVVDEKLGIPQEQSYGE